MAAQGAALHLDRSVPAELGQGAALGGQVSAQGKLGGWGPGKEGAQVEVGHGQAELVHGEGV